MSRTDPMWRPRRVHGLLLIPAPGELWRNRDGHWYILDRRGGQLIVRLDPPAAPPARMGYGLWREAERPYALWVRDRHGLRRIHSTPAARIAAYAALAAHPRAHTPTRHHPPLGIAARMSSMSDRPRRPKGLPAQVAGTWMPADASGADDLIPPPDEPLPDMWDPAWDEPTDTPPAPTPRPGTDPWACDPNEPIDPHGFDEPRTESAPDRNGPPADWGLDMRALEARCETYIDIRHSFEPVRVVRRDGRTTVTARDLDRKGRECTFDTADDDFGLADGVEIACDGDTWTRTITLPPPPAPGNAPAPTPPPPAPTERRATVRAHAAAGARAVGRRPGRLAVALMIAGGLITGVRRTLRRALGVALR